MATVTEHPEVGKIQVEKAAYASDLAKQGLLQRAYEAQRAAAGANNTSGQTTATQPTTNARTPIIPETHVPTVNTQTGNLPSYANAGAAANINGMYDASAQARLNALSGAYQRNLSNAVAAYGKIDPAYQQKANDLGVQFERNRRNFNIQAAGNGLNTGVGSQAALAQNAAYQRDYGNLRVAQQNALDEAQRGINDLAASYQSDVNTALAEIEFQRAQALQEQQLRDYQNQLTLAANLAKYGDFSLYKTLGYTDAQINQMYNDWKVRNPEVAYNTGKIDANTYYKYTGKWPAGYTPPSSGGGGGGGYGGPANNNNNKGVTYGDLVRVAQENARNQTTLANTRGSTNIYHG